MKVKCTALKKVLVTLLELLGARGIVTLFPRGCAPAISYPFLDRFHDLHVVIHRCPHLPAFDDKRTTHTRLLFCCLQRTRGAALFRVKCF